jgi:hypothetical protein
MQVKDDYVVLRHRNPASIGQLHRLDRVTP